MKRRNFLSLVMGAAAAPVAAKVAGPVLAPPVARALPPVFAVSGERIVANTLTARTIYASEIVCGSITPSKIWLRSLAVDRIDPRTGEVSHA